MMNGVALRMVVLMSALVGASANADAARLALVIGNDTYSHVSSLTNARNDANLIATTLHDGGFQVVGGVRQNLDRNAIWNAIDQFRHQIAKGDDVVFYYAGHGVQIGADSLLLPVDIDAETEEQVLRNGVNLVEVQDALKNARFALLIIDACRNNPFPPKAGRTRSIGEVRGLLPVEAAEGNAILLSASRGQTALDFVPGITTSNGLFTYRLAQAMRTPGVDILSALRQVRDNVEDEAMRANHQQRPALVEELRGEFVLFPSSAPPVTQPVHAMAANQITQGGVATAGGAANSGGGDPRANAVTAPAGDADRGGEDTIDDLQLQNSGLLRDRRTGLEWTAKDSGGLLGWKDAEKYCAALKMRLPTSHELQTIYRVEYDENTGAKCPNLYHHPDICRVSKKFHLPTSEFVWTNERKGVFGGEANVFDLGDPGALGGQTITWDLEGQTGGYYYRGTLCVKGP